MHPRGRPRGLRGSCHLFAMSPLLGPNLLAAPDPSTVHAHVHMRAKVGFHHRLGTSGHLVCVPICTGISIQNLGLLLPGLLLARCETSKMNGEGRCTKTVGGPLISTVCCLPSRVLRAGPASFPWIVAAGPGDGIHSGPRRGSHARGSMSILSQSQLLQFCAIRYVPTLSTCTSMQCRTVQWEVRCANPHLA